MGAKNTTAEDFQSLEPTECITSQTKPNTSEYNDLHGLCRMPSNVGFVATAVLVEGNSSAILANIPLYLYDLHFIMHFYLNFVICFHDTKQSRPRKQQG